MKQVFVDKNGEVIIKDMPNPVCQDNGVIVSNMSSLISAGTETTSIEEKSEGIISKIVGQPELIKKVVEKVKKDGLLETAKFVQDRENILLNLGYSCAGTVLEVGRNVAGIKIGDKVSCGGAGYANHAEINYIPKNLVALIPEGLEFKNASFATLGSIALQSIRRAKVELGETVLVIGLGLIGQITCQILRACACKVVGLDILKEKVDLAQKLGLDYGSPDDKEVEEKIKKITNGFGADAVIICASTQGNEPVELACRISRKKGRIVVVGAVSMNIPRTPFYEKELDFLISTSYGPGRYDYLYEEKGLDYPFSYVRWTEQRNMQSFLELLAGNKIKMEPLISRQYPLEQAKQAYEYLKKNAGSIGVLLNYTRQDDYEKREHKLILNVHPRSKNIINLALIGCGGLAQNIHLPNIKKNNQFRLTALVDLDGQKVKRLTEKYSADYCSTDYHEVLKDPDIDAVIIATRHNLHSALTIDSINSSKDVLVEKPLALSYEEMSQIEKALTSNPVNLTVGYNRRYSPFILRTKELLKTKDGPLMINYRVNAGYLPPDSWVFNPAEGGGRIIGECCHFFDLFNFLIGSDVIKISAQKASTFTEDNFVVSLEYQDGSVANLLYTSLGNNLLSKERIEIYKDKGIIIIDDFICLEIWGIEKNRSVRVRKQDKGFMNELEEFAKIIKGEKSSSVNLEEIKKSMEICFAVVDSLKKR